VIWVITYPSNQKLPSTATLAGVDNLLNEKFLQAVSGQDWSRLGLHATREQGVVVRVPPLEFRRMENRVCMGPNVQGVGGC
jgi:hypothetical protein